MRSITRILPVQSTSNKTEQEQELVMTYPVHVVCHIPAAPASAAAVKIKRVQLCAAAAVLMGVADVDVVGPVYVC